jgi:uncharacterized protein YwqG
VASNDDLTSLNETQLVQAYIDNVQFFETIGHVGRKNRLMQRRLVIVAELKARGDDTLQSLRGLLDHMDPKLRYAAASAFKTIDDAAYERTLRALAERKDPIGRDARSSLEFDALIRKHGDPQPQKKEPREPESFASQAGWQSGNPPPKAPTRAEIEQELVGALPPASADRLIRLARPAIGLWPQRPRPDLPVGASRLGGMPYAPPGWSWPIYETEPMLFLGHLNCADLQGLPGAETLPSAGLLAFFGDHDAVTGCDFAFGSRAAVHYWTDIDRLAPAVPPIEIECVFPLCELAFRPLIDLPHQFSRAVEEILTDSEESSRYFEIRHAAINHGIPDDLRGYCGFSKLFGWPSLIQRDLDCIGDPADPNGFRLLLELDEYSNGTDSEGWGPGGSLYFLIGDADLRARRFDRCEFEMQCT